MEVVYGKDGNPLMMMGKKTIAITSNVGKKVIEETFDKFSYNKREYAMWGAANRQPNEDNELIRKTTVLRTGLSYKCRIVHGESCIPVIISGYDAKCNEIYKPIENTEFIRYLNSYVFEKYLTETVRDLFNFGNTFPVYTFNADATKILRTTSFSARHCRISIDKTKLLVYNDFNNTMPKDGDAYELDMLDETDPYYHLWLLKEQKKLNGKQIAFPRIKNYFCSNDYYATPDWYSARDAGWIEIAHKAAKFIKKTYENMMAIKLHIKIPTSYWDKHFPKSEFPDVKERQAKINQFMDSIESSLCGEENANKALFSPFTAEELQGADKWEIDEITSKKTLDEKLSTSAAGNSEILFSLMVNPSVLGAGMPGGPYSGNAGSGSDIREGFTVAAVLSHIERQQVVDPIEMMWKFNGFEDVQIKYLTKFLTTLDKGKSTEGEIL